MPEESIIDRINRLSAPLGNRRYRAMGKGMEKDKIKVKVASNVQGQMFLAVSTGENGKELREWNRK